MAKKPTKRYYILKQKAIRIESFCQKITVLNKNINRKEGIESVLGVVVYRISPYSQYFYLKFSF